MKRNRFFILGIAPFVGFLSGCYAGNLPHGTVIVPVGGLAPTTTVITHYEPPPHSPAHGYRHSYYNHRLQFDTGFGAYVVIGNPGLYFYNNYYMRFYSGGWQISNRLGNPWLPAHQNNIPHQLRKLHTQKHWRHDDDVRHDEAPRHGYRRHHQGHELSYDSHAGAYVIPKRPGIYFYNNRYLRHHRGRWQSTNKLHGAWRPAKKQHIPGTLMKIKHFKKDTHDKREKHKNQH
ncbi:MAG: hypothetical protein GXP18_00245 [Gammaproteobacteria bacterium]|nr:hypothetical protein [Gammaproteobacteria bacterium]